MAGLTVERAAEGTGAGAAPQCKQSRRAVRLFRGTAAVQLHFSYRLSVRKDGTELTSGTAERLQYQDEHPGKTAGRDPEGGGFQTASDLSRRRHWPASEDALLSALLHHPESGKYQSQAVAILNVNVLSLKVGTIKWSLFSGGLRSQWAGRRCTGFPWVFHGFLRMLQTFIHTAFPRHTKTVLTKLSVLFFLSH